ncbi:MAG: hypothetical protein U0Q22_01565 [Acidimicrobiales bacterium]
MSDDQKDRKDEDGHDLDPEPLDIDLEDVKNAFPHGDNPHPPSESEVQVPG